MKTLKIYFSIAVVALFMLASCTKEETKDYVYDVHHSTTDGQARIKGNVTYLNAATGNYEAAPWAVIKIASDTVTKTFNQYWMADSTGAYSVKGLGVGSYFITSQYTDAFTGAKFSTAGSILIVKNSVDDITLDFKVK